MTATANILQSVLFIVGIKKSWAILPHRRMALCKRGLACECKLTARPCTNQSGMTTELMMWTTPLEASMSATITVESP